MQLTNIDKSKKYGVFDTIPDYFPTSHQPVLAIYKIDSEGQRVGQPLATCEGLMIESKTGEFVNRFGDHLPVEQRRRFSPKFYAITVAVIALAVSAAPLSYNATGENRMTIELENERLSVMINETLTGGGATVIVSKHDSRAWAIGFGVTLYSSLRKSLVELKKQQLKIMDTGQQHGPELPPMCAECSDTGYTGPYYGGSTITYLCSCDAGGRQLAVEEECYLF